jgi:hypothetical protein
MRAAWRGRAFVKKWGNTFQEAGSVADAAGRGQQARGASPRADHGC